MNLPYSGGTAFTVLLLTLSLGHTLADGDNLNVTNSGDITSTSTDSTNSTNTKTKCQGRKMLDACLAKLPPILGEAEMTGIPSTKEEVEVSCSAFKTGMGCIDAYSENCLKPQERKILEDHVAGARYTFRFLCDDPGFQSEYLKYKTCYRGVSKDWDACANRFVLLVKEEMNRKNATQASRLMELCCAKHGFLRCVYAASRYKCRKEEALFVKKIAETLSDTRVYSQHCKNVDTQLCSHSSTHRAATSFIVMTMLTATYFSLHKRISLFC